MKRKVLILSAFFACFYSMQVFSKDVDYSKYFSKQALRIDYVHYGDAKTEGIAFSGLVALPRWGGNPDHLITPFNYGNYRVVVETLETHKVLFTKGFSTLFWEYTTTKPAKDGIVRAIEESITIPMPLKPVRVKILKRHKDGKFYPLWSLKVEPSDYRIVRQQPDKNVMVIKAVHNGDPAHSLDIAVVGDGYCRDEVNKFKGDLQHLINVLLHTKPFSTYKEKLNIYGVLKVSEDCGVTEPRKQRYLRTAVGSNFDTFRSARYLTTTHDKALRAVLESVPYDAIYIMANSARYGGGGIYNLYAVFTSDNEWTDYLATHEFGHSFAALGDEYYTSSTAYLDFYEKGVEPWEPNITARPKHPKWASMIKPGTPLPTPDKPQYYNVVGAFEGAGYIAKGLYRPQHTCKMKDKGFLPYCRVCTDAIGRMIQYYVGH